MNLKIFDQKSKNNEYRSKAFRLYIDPKGNKTSRKEKNDTYKMLDIDKILEKKFSFKKMSEIQEHKFQELKLDYNEGFIYFLLSNDFSNEKYIQESSKLSDFIIPNFIKSETILKILDYSIKTNNGSITNKTLDFLRNKFENSKDLFDTFAGLKNSLGFNENELFEFFIGNPPTIHQILKCGDTKSSQ